MSTRSETIMQMYCDGCFDELKDSEGRMFSAGSYRELQLIAQRSGWSTGDDKDLCPDCTGEGDA